MNLLLSGILAVASVGTPFTPSSSAIEKLHPYLLEQILRAPAGGQLPVYFVIGERLEYDHWFPRVDRLPLAERRALVVAEGRAHAARTQAPLLELLRDAVAVGGAEALSSNWAGNFVQCRAGPDVILAAAALPSVSEVWFDYVPPPAQVEDGAAPAETETGPPAVSLPAGDGPLDTQADQCWALGVTGAGIVVMNVDSGINVNHSDLASRLWVNPGEIPGNGIDDDANGFIDDVHGWDFGFNSSNIDDFGGHGTNTAGCIVADGTCSGTVYGQAPGARVITGRIFGETGSWNAIQYALSNGADCQTSSHSYKNDQFPPPNYMMHRDVGETSLAAGLIRTNSTSNNGGACAFPFSLTRRPFNISAPGCVPSPYRDPNQTLVGRNGGVLGVGAHDVGTSSLNIVSPCGPFAWDLADLLVVNPNFPPANWDIVNDNDYPYAGGSQIALLKPDVSGPTGVTTTSGNGTCGTIAFSGTSCATPVVSGVLCLWKSANPSLDPEDVAMIVHQSSVSTGSVPGKENGFGAGKVDARTGLDLALCVHRVNGETPWTTTHRVNTSVVVELDTLPNTAVVLGMGTTRTAGFTGGGVVGIGGEAVPYFIGTSNAQGDLSANFHIPPSLVGTTLYTQGFSSDSAVTGTPGAPRVLSSNVVGVTFVP